MPQPRTARHNSRLVILTVSAFLISGIIAASRSPSQQQGHMIPPQLPQAAPIGIRILSPTRGVDFLLYLTPLNTSIGDNFLAKKPRATGEGVAVVQVRMPKDGSLHDDSVTLVSSSGNQDVDAAAWNAIRAAAPFARLPEAYPSAYLELQFLFYYKRKPPEPGQKPEVVPVVTALIPTVL